MEEQAFNELVREFEVCLSCYRQMVDNITKLSGLQIATLMPYRDGIAWILETLGGYEGPLYELAELDQRLKENSKYVLHSAGWSWAEDYRDSENIPRSHWWWYLEELESA
jgi:hypothetical protein